MTSTESLYLYLINSDHLGTGYWCLEHGKLDEYLEMNDLSKFVSKALLSMLTGLLKTNEIDRFQARDVIHHKWFKGYYQKYSGMLEDKSLSQRKRADMMRTKMQHFPFYDATPNMRESTVSDPKSVPFSLLREC